MATSGSQQAAAPPANRTPSGRRNCEQGDLSRLTFVRWCRDFGFGIEQVRMPLSMSISAERDCTETREIVQAHLDKVRGKITDLRSVEARLDSFVTRCNVACAGGPGQDWVICKDMNEVDGC